jgi:hypothetical protein
MFSQIKRKEKFMNLKRNEHFLPYCCVKQSPIKPTTPPAPGPTNPPAPGPTTPPAPGPTTPPAPTTPPTPLPNRPPLATGVNKPPNLTDSGYVLLSYFCTGYDSANPKATGYCSINQLIQSGVNWILIGFSNIDWGTGIIDENSIKSGTCCKGSDLKYCLSPDMLNVLKQFHDKGNIISLSIGGKGSRLPPILTDEIINKMVSSFTNLRKTVFHNSLDGIDFDMESASSDCTETSKTLVSIAKAFQKAGYIVSMAPMASQFHVGQAAGFNNIINNLDSIDAIMPQWYQPECPTTGHLFGPGGQEIGYCPSGVPNWGTTAISFIDYFQKYGSACNDNQVISTSANKWHTGAIFGECKECVKFPGDLLRKFIVGVATYGNQTYGRAKPSDIQNIIKTYPKIGGVGTWAIYHQCGTGDNTAATEFAELMGLPPPPDLSWYSQIAKILKK